MDIHFYYIEREIFKKIKCLKTVSVYGDFPKIVVFLKWDFIK